jgi:hypothetical protein
MKDHLALFEEYKIRRVYDEKLAPSDGEKYFTDVAKIIYFDANTPACAFQSGGFGCG